MRKLRHLVVLVAISTALSGCATPTREQLADADYGSPPDGFEEIIKSYLFRALKDPASAQYNFNSLPTKTWSRKGFGSSFIYGWGVCALINAKNSFGAYVGYQPQFFLIRDGRVAVALEPGPASNNACKSTAF